MLKVYRILKYSSKVQYYSKSFGQGVEILKTILDFKSFGQGVDDFKDDIGF
jgi:hypothetical protein